MSELLVYFARAMDARSEEDILFEENYYRDLLASVGGKMANPYVKGSKNIIEEGLSIAENDLAILKTSDLILVDLSIPDYQYVGCLFEIVYASILDIPIVLVVGETKLHERVFFQAYSDFIARKPQEAINYIWRAHIEKGIEGQLSEMKAYYDEIAHNYKDKWVERHRNEDVNGHQNERKQLRALLRRYVQGRTCQFGVGTGDWTKTICENAKEVLGIEQSKMMLEEARKNLSIFNNICLFNMDVLAESIAHVIGEPPLDCVVVNFLLSILPSSIQKKIFNLVKQILRPGGLLIIADTKHVSTLSTVGLGARQLQIRESNQKKYVLYKEHFVGESLSKLVSSQGFKIIESSKDTFWFSWVVACV